MKPLNIENGIPNQDKVSGLPDDIRRYAPEPAVDSRKRAQTTDELRESLRNRYRRMPWRRTHR